jgi:hypothetical protein
MQISPIRSVVGDRPVKPCFDGLNRFGGNRIKKTMKALPLRGKPSWFCSPKK